MKKVFFILVSLSVAGIAHAQTTGDVLKASAGQGVHDGAQMATQQTANNVSNRLLDKLFNKKKKGIDSSKLKPPVTSGGTAATGTASPSSTNVNAGSASNTNADASLKTYSKYDFIPGDKILHVEDFSGDAVGDWPVRWNTNGTGEVQTIEGKTGKWLAPGNNTLFYPEYVTELPENFTLQFDLVCSENYSYYSSALMVSCVAMKTPAKDFTRLISDVPKDAVEIRFHPQDANATLGHTNYDIWENSQRIIHNDASNTEFVSQDPARRSVKVSIWRQATRLRVYLNEQKVWDLPRAFDATKNYNTLLFGMQDTRPNNKLLFSNVRLAVGTPDTRNKLMTEGKFSTTGILFDVNSATIKPESYGTLKDIASVLTENAAVRVKIIGHTDNDGDATMNLTLSQKRAEAVKASLIKEFGIDASRMDTDGKGSTQPAAPNTTPEGKAQNRRVEFVKI